MNQVLDEIEIYQLIGEFYELEKQYGTSVFLIALGYALNTLKTNFTMSVLSELYELGLTDGS